jgi:tetratricopeptide (TPR) repeat protein
MSLNRQYQYSNTAQRKIIEYNHVLSFVLLGIVFSDLYISLKYYFFYAPVISVLLILGFGGLFLGTFLGKLLYFNNSRYRIIYCVSELFIIILSLLYLLRNLAVPVLGDPFLDLIRMAPYAVPAVIFIASILFGIKFNYSGRVASGDYIDKKQGTERFIGFLFLGVMLGILLDCIVQGTGLPLFILALVPLLITPSTFMINLPYNPETQYARDDEEEKRSESSAGSDQRTDTPFFTYLNVMYIIIYGYIGYAVIARCYGNATYVTLLFVAIFFIIIAAGDCVGRLIPLVHAHVFLQSLLPAALMTFLILVMSIGSDLYFSGGILLFAPTALVLGILLYHSLQKVSAIPDSRKRASIMEFAFFIMPTPVIITLSIIDFSNLLFYIFICIVMLMSVIIPSIYMVNSAIRGYKKAIYFFISLFFLPLFIFMILFFNIPLDSGMYVTRVGNFEVLRNVNYNADYIRVHATVTMNGMPVFRITDSVVRNYKRSLVPLSIYHPEDGSILFIDGNQRFFRNPVIGYYKNSSCLDEMNDRNVDFNKLPYTGTQRYVPDTDPLLLYLMRGTKRYHTVVDIPNLLDQSLNAFRFSADYYAVIKKIIEPNGLFVQVFNVPECRPGLFSTGIRNLRRAFTSHAVYFFSNMMVVISSNGGLSVDKDAYGRLDRLFASHDELKDVFENETHVLSHLLYTGISEMLPLMPQEGFVPGAALLGQERLKFKPKMYDSYLANNRKVFDQLGRSDDYTFVQAITQAFQNEDEVLTLLKKTELAEARERYPEETRLMFDLKKQAEFRISLQDYVRKMLAYKEKYYYHAAVQLEKNRKWTEAQELYRAVLTLNPDSFEANYRMGILCITVQDIEGSFKYLNEAMRINSNHPKVLYQMGVLYFSSGKTEDALRYFERALQQNEKSPSIYRYIGLCNDKLGKLYEAEQNYAKAMIADPNDVDTKARLGDVRSRIEKENRKWDMPEQKNEAEAEQDSEMPLPVSKGAYDVRLKDNDETLPVIDPITGEEIQTDKSDGTEAGGAQPQPQAGPAPDNAAGNK